MNKMTEEYFTKMEQGEIVELNNEHYMKVGMLLINVKDDNDFLMLAIDF